MDSKKCVLVDRTVLFYHYPMNGNAVWGVLKWVLAALVAGFIGQFGKSLALFLMKRRRAKRSQDAEASPASLTPKTSSSDADVQKATLEAHAKIEKKQAKAEIKRLKKS